MLFNIVTFNVEPLLEMSKRSCEVVELDVGEDHSMKDEKVDGVCGRV